MRVAEGGYRWIPEWAFGLFNIFRNNLEEGMNSGITKVADVAKLFVAGLRVRVRAECGDWQKDLTRSENEMAGEIQCR